MKNEIKEILENEFWAYYGMSATEITDKIWKVVEFKEVENMSNFPFDKLPTGGMQLYNPKYRDMPLHEVIEQSRVSIEYVPYGYNYFVLVRSTGIIHAYKI